MPTASCCQFIMMAANTANIPTWLNHRGGRDMTKEELLEVGERIANMRIAFEVREGGNPRRRQVPDRLVGRGEAVLAEGSHKDFTLDTETLELEFLKEADWDPQTSKPSRAKLGSLSSERRTSLLHRGIRIVCGTAEGGMENVAAVESRPSLSASGSLPRPAATVGAILRRAGRQRYAVRAG